MMEANYFAHCFCPPATVASEDHYTILECFQTNRNARDKIFLRAASCLNSRSPAILRAYTQAPAVSTPTCTSSQSLLFARHTNQCIHRKNRAIATGTNSNHSIRGLS